MIQRVPIDVDYANALFPVMRVYDNRGFDAALSRLKESPVRNWLDYHQRYEGYPNWQKITPENEGLVAIIDVVVADLNKTSSKAEFEFCITVLHDILYGDFYYEIPSVVTEH